MKKQLPILELNEKFDKLVAEQLMCPICGVRYILHVPYINVPCTKCGNTYRTDFKQDIYTKIARRLNSLLAWNNGCIIKASDAYEGDITHIKNHFEKMHNWDVSEMTSTTREYRRCNQCGICRNCFTCKECGKTFTKDPNRRKQMCPHCKSKKFVQTYFKEAFSPEENKKIRLCPYCKSDSLVMTKSRIKSKCHLCESKNMSDKKTEREFKLTIKRKRAYMIENV